VYTELAQLAEALCYKAEGRGFDSRLGSVEFFRQPSNRNDYQGYLMEGQRRSYTFTCRLSTNSMTFNLLEPWRPIQVCNGIAYTGVSSPAIRRPRREAIHLNLLTNLRIRWVTPWTLTQVFTTWYFNDAQGLFVNTAINIRVDRTKLDGLSNNLWATSEFQSQKGAKKRNS